MKRRIFVLLLVLALCLAGCEKTPGEETLPSVTETVPTTAVPTTVPPETSAPPQTTEPAGPMYPAVPVTQADHILITETAPEYDINASGNIIMESDIENSSFSSSYIHLFAAAASARDPFDGDVFWIYDGSYDGSVEMHQGNHYINYILENGQLKQLKKHYFSESYTLLGTTVELKLEYSLLGDRVLINYVPARSEYPYARVFDTDRGVHECLVQFELPQADNRYACYYAKVDLETGELTDFLGEFNPELFLEDTRFWLWCDNGSLILSDLFDPYCVPYCFDVINHTKREYELGNEQYEARLHSWKELPDGLLCRVDYYVPGSNSKSQKAEETRLLMINREDGSMILLPNGSQFDRFVSYGRGFILFQDSSKMYYVYNTVSNEYAALPDMKSVFLNLTSTFIYLNHQNVYCVYDAADGESVELEIPEDFKNRLRYYESYDGRKIINAYLDETGIYQFFVFDADSNTLIELRRGNEAGVREHFLQWAQENNKVIITLDDSGKHQNFVIYDFHCIPRE